MTQRGRVLVRPTVREDLAFVSNEPLPARVQCVTGIQDGAIIAVGGLQFRPDGTVWFSAQLSEAARAAKVTLHKAALAVLEQADRDGIARIYATADPAVPRAGAWLERLGFVRFDAIYIRTRGGRRR